LDEDALYNQYDFNEPWDGPNNRLLRNATPRAYTFASGNSGGVFAITGEGTAFSYGNQISIGQFERDPKDVILLALCRDRHYNWLEPIDISIDDTTVVRAVGTTVDHGLNKVLPNISFVGFADSNRAFAMLPRANAGDVAAMAKINVTTRSQSRWEAQSNGIIFGP
jgi:hypothetical protein